MTYEQFLKALGRNIRRIRKENVGISLNMAAHLAFMKWSQLDAIEKGQANPTLRTIDRIADALGVGMETLFRFDDNKTVPKENVSSKKKISKTS